MPDKLKENAGRIISAAFFILLSVQIITGCIWGICNFASLQDFSDTTGLLNMSESLNLKGDTGVIYPALLAVFRTLTLNIPVRYFEVMYILQLVLSFISWFIFAEKVLQINKKLPKVWFALAVVTCPYAMQCHEAVLEYSFASSLLCLLISFLAGFMREWKEDEKTPGTERALRDISVLSLFWLLLSLLRTEYTFIGFIPVAIFLIMLLRKFKPAKKYMLTLPLVIVIAFYLIITMTDSLFREGERLTPIDHIERGMYYRVAWSEDIDEKYFWPAHVVTVVDEDTMIRTMNDPGLVTTDFTDAVADLLGRRGASKAMLSWAWDAFKDNKTAMTKDTLTELFGYVFTPAVTEMKMSGIGFPGYSLGNYSVMRRNAPVLTKYYFRFSSVLYCFMAALTAVYLLLIKPDHMKTFIPAFVTMCFASVVYTFSGNNVWDHRKALFATCMWAAAFAGCAVSIFGKEKSGD